MDSANHGRRHCDLDDGSFRISPDGDRESGVPERYIRRIQTRRRPSKAVQPGSQASARSPLKAIHNKVRGTPVSPQPAASCATNIVGTVHLVCRERVAPILRQTESQSTQLIPAASPAPDSSAVVYCDSGYPLALSQQLQIWDGQGDVLPQNGCPGAVQAWSSDVYGSTLSPKRQNEALGQRSVSGSLSLNLPGVVSETPYYYRKQKQQQMQQQRYSKQQLGCPDSDLPAGESYIKGGKSEAQIESEVDYEPTRKMRNGLRL